MTQSLADSGNFLPGDPEQSRYRFIIVAARRSRQLNRTRMACVSDISLLNKRTTVAAMEEARRGSVEWGYPPSERDGQ